MNFEKFNVNRSARVVLTERGAEILNLHLKAYYHIGRKEVPPVIYSAGDTYETELWNMMNIFGKHIYDGCVIPFEGNEIEIEDDGHPSDEK